MNHRAKAAWGSAVRTPDNWIQTYTGRQFWPLAPAMEDLHLVDIAHALSLLCRFNGHCNRFYSVAEHSLHVASLLPAALVPWGLLHDASEAYLSDLPKPLKGEMADYRQAEETLNQLIARRYHLIWPMPAPVKQADAILLATEKRDLMGPEPASWGALPAPVDPAIIQGYPPARAEALLLEALARHWPEDMAG